VISLAYAFLTQYCINLLRKGLSRIFVVIMVLHIIIGLYKSKVVPVLKHRNLKTCWGSGCESPPILNSRREVRVKGQLHTPAALFPWKAISL